MDIRSIAEAVRTAADHERFLRDAIAGKTPWPPRGLFLPRAALLSQLEFAASILAALSPVVVRGDLIMEGDIVHVRMRVIEHYGDGFRGEFPSIGSNNSDSALVGLRAVTQIEERAAR